MSEHDSLEIQWNKLVEGYKNIPSSVISVIKEKILSCIVSKDMQDYLSTHFDELRSWDLIAIIAGPQKSLEFKSDIFSEIARLFPHPFDELDSCYDFEPYAELYKAASVDMNADSNVFNVYLLYQHEYSESDSDTCQDTRPFPTFASAINYIRGESDKWFRGENLDEALTWFTIEKWIGNDQTSMKATYTVSKYATFDSMEEAENVVENIKLELQSVDKGEETIHAIVAGKGKSDTGDFEYAASEIASYLWKANEVAVFQHKLSAKPAKSFVSLLYGLAPFEERSMLQAMNIWYEDLKKEHPGEDVIELNLSDL